jgi:hypothetical protein
MDDTLVAMPAQMAVRVTEYDKDFPNNAGAQRAIDRVAIRKGRAR